MDFTEYQARATETAVYPGQGEFTGLAYAALGLSGEAGETAEQVKKTWRDDGESVTNERRVKILKELGDVLWYVAVLADYLDLSLDDIATTNLAKLASRQGRGLLGGSGDNR